MGSDELPIKNEVLLVDFRPRRLRPSSTNSVPWNHVFHPSVQRRQPDVIQSRGLEVDERDRTLRQKCPHHRRGQSDRQTTGVAQGLSNPRRTRYFTFNQKETARFQSVFFEERSISQVLVFVFQFHIKASTFFFNSKTPAKRKDI